MHSIHKSAKLKLMIQFIISVKLSVLGMNFAQNALRLIVITHYMRKNAQVVAVLMKTGLNNVLLPTLFRVVNNIGQYCTPNSGSTILFNIVDNCEQRGQQNIVQSC